MSVVCCQVEVSASGSSRVQRSPTEYGVSDCDREAPYGEAVIRNRVEQPQKKTCNNCRVLVFHTIFNFVIIFFENV